MPEYHLAYAEDTHDDGEYSRAQGNADRWVGDSQSWIAPLSMAGIPEPDAHPNFSTHQNIFSLNAFHLGPDSHGYSRVYSMDIRLGQVSLVIAPSFMEYLEAWCEKNPQVGQPE